MALQGNWATAIGDLVTSLAAGDLVNINETIFQENFIVGNFAQAHTVVTDRRDGQLQPILEIEDYYGSMPKGDATSCALNACDITPVYSSKTWCLTEQNCRLEICMRSFDENFLIFWNQYRQQLEDPLTEPDTQVFLDYVVNIVSERIQGTEWRIGYWGDTSLTANDYVNGCDGYFVQAEAGGGEKVELVGAVAGSFTPEELYAAMQKAYVIANNSVWASATDIVWKMPYTVAAELVTWLNTMQDTSQYNCDCFDANGIVSARRFNVAGLQIFGIPVEAHREINLSAGAGGVTGLGLYKILLTKKSNLLIGVNTTDKMEGFDIMYDKISRKIYIDSIVKLGVMIPLDDYVYISDETPT